MSGPRAVSNETLLSFCDKSVTEPRFAHEIPRLGWIRFDLPAQLRDQHPQVLWLVHRARAPDLFENFAMREGPIGVVRKQRQQLKLLGSETNFLGPSLHAPAVVVDGELTCVHLPADRLFLTGRAAKRDANSRQQFGRAERFRDVVVGAEIEQR